ncbi:putative membrane protein [Ogataea parapolymorpha DL-1]|uniref:Membrane protein n=1 Tax=Ogataea parapolymorpha (strain ATCC 26012 / BCRC 20466 / JCM 22074 / NRRL Y-7560 / DL-1) TaxID=871575 RepID=W1QKL0_OGAPD|nr:putative membrane protein [Ogataea parapolymorpha DL-1]ESX02771.1 putative membrane protein [Ogataea parapolymorpha DL-1]
MSYDYDLTVSMVLASLRTAILTASRYISQFKQAYPEIWSLFMYFLVLYVSAKLVLRMARMIYRTFVNTIKLVIFLAAVAVAIQLWNNKPELAELVPQIQYTLIQLYRLLKMIVTFLAGTLTRFDWRNFSKVDLDRLLDSLKATRSQFETLFQLRLD